MKIFITGATGCIGHYVLDILGQNPKHELHLLVRDPNRLRSNWKDHPRVTCHVGNMEDVSPLKSVIPQMDAIMHIATDWSDSDYAIKLNVENTHKLFDMADPEKCQKIVYFSTASILGPQNKPTPAAGKYGAGYVRSKYHAYDSLEKCQLIDRIVTIFPTLVFGGDPDHPYSHITQGIKPNLNYLKWLRFFYVDGAFHFMHGYDIAQMAVYALEHDTPANMVVGQDSITAKIAIQALCKTFDIPQWLRFRIPKKFIFGMAKMIRAQIGPWERHCIENSYMVYDVVNPETYGLTSKFPTIQTLLEDIKQLPDG